MDRAADFKVCGLQMGGEWTVGFRVHVGKGGVDTDGCGGGWKEGRDSFAARSVEESGEQAVSALRLFECDAFEQAICRLVRDAG